MWYTDPAWWALPIAIVSLIISIFILVNHTKYYKGEKEKRKSEVQRNLIRQAVEINEAFVKLNVKGPYAHFLNIPDDNIQKFTAKSVMLLNQINMLRDAFQNRTIIGVQELNVYTNWISTVFRPWIESDEDLKKAWSLFKKAEDLNHPDFSKWLSKQLPIL